MMNRREVLAAIAVATMAKRPAASEAVSVASEDTSAHARSGLPSIAADDPALRTSMGVNLYSFAYRSPKSAYDFLEYCHSLGAGGVQTELTSLDSEDLRKLRGRAEELGMYLEVIADLPGEDAARFEQTVKAAKEAGALCLRSACLGGRRYETFSSLDQWMSFVAASKAKLARAIPVLERNHMAMGIENHKDWTAEELAALLKSYESEYLGACIDTGNNIALLDDPYTVVELLAPYAVCTHIKDMAVEEYPEGFLLAEIPLGEGMLDMKRIVGTISAARPKTRLTLEMITRDPLKVPCLTEKYWATFPSRSGVYLARALTLVRSHKPRAPLPEPDSLGPSARLQAEEANVTRCLAYARERLGLQ